MSFQAISGIAELDASGYVSETDDVIGAQEDLSTSSETAAGSLFQIDAAGAAAGAAMAGLGTAMQGSLDSTRDVREELARVEQQTDMTEDELVELTTTLSDATLSHEEIAGSMREFQGMGVETREEMERYIEAADTIADATGSSADAIARDLGPQIRALDGDLDALENRQDAFVIAAEQSTLSIEDIGRNLGQLDFEPLREMEVSSDEAALAMAEFADKTGLPPRQLRTEFRNAVEESDGDIRQFEENLGFAEGTLEDLSAEVENNAGVAQEQADAVGEQASMTDEMRASFADARLAAADYLGPVDAAAPALQAAGSATLLYSTVNWGSLIPSMQAGAGAALAKASALTGAVVPALTATTVAGAPVWALVLGLAAIVGALALAWRSNFLGIQDITEDVFGKVGNLIDWIIDKINAIPGIDIGAEDVEDPTPDDTPGTGDVDTVESDSYIAADAPSEMSVEGDVDQPENIGLEGGIEEPSVEETAPASRRPVQADDELLDKIIDQLVMLREETGKNTRAVKDLVGSRFEMEIQTDDRELERIIRRVSEAVIVEAGR